MSLTFQNRGILETFDKHLEPVAHTVGVRPQQFVDAHVPAAFAGLLQLIYDIQLSPFGSLVASSVTGAGLAAMTAYSGKSQADGEKILATEMSANLIWNNLRYANPKVSPAISAGATAAFAAIMAGDLGAFYAALTGNPAGFLAQSKEVANINNTPQHVHRNTINDAVSKVANGGSGEDGGLGLGLSPFPIPTTGNDASVGTTQNSSKSASSYSKNVRFH